MTTIAECLRFAEQSITEDTAPLDAMILLAHVLDRDKSYLLCWPDKALDAQQVRHFKTLIRQRARGIPVAYLTGRKDFWDMTLTVNPHVLVPRPETELLVEQALARIPVDAAWRILDIGTGSGAIALVLARERPGCHITATDISAQALEVARQNARDLALENMQLRLGDLFEPVAGERFHMIVSNPPYVDLHDPRLASLAAEPQTALRAAEQGMACLRKLVRQAVEYLTDPGWLLLEHGFDQRQPLTGLLKQTGYRDIQCHRDLAGLDRLCSARLSKLATC